VSIGKADGDVGTIWGRFERRSERSGNRGEEAEEGEEETAI
jgi:hypothetical protein